MITTISEILELTKEEELVSQFKQLEAHFNMQVISLITNLSKSVTSDVSQLQNHMADVECWRDRITKYHALMSTFVDHCKSSHFLLPMTKEVKIMDREAHQKKLLAGFVGMKTYCEHLINTIDSRVNICKILLRSEIGGATPTTFR